MKLKTKLFLLITIFAIACTQAVPAFAASAADLKLQAQTAIVMDAATGEVLYEKDINKKMEPASTTKIVTCLLALEHLKLDQVITAAHDGSDMGSNISIKKGEQFKVEDLLYALMLPSANDAAVVLAEEIGGSVDNFCKMMDEKAKDCGAKNSHFLNPNGLNWQGQEAHLTSAYDLAVITKAALQNETFRKLVSTVFYTIPATNKSKERELYNTNKCLWDTKSTKLEYKTDTGEEIKTEFVPKYQGTIGVKTGLTSTAGACLVAAVDRNGTELISVVLHSGNDARFYDTAQLWDYTLETYYNTTTEIKQGEEVGKVRVKRGEHRNVEAVAESSASITARKGTDLSDVRTEFEKMELEAPVKKGDKIGVAKVYHGDQLVSQTNVLAKETVEKGGPLSYFGIPDWMAVMLYIALAILILIAVILRRLGRGGRRRKRRKRKSKRRSARQRSMPPVNQPPDGRGQRSTAGRSQQPMRREQDRRRRK